MLQKGNKTTSNVFNPLQPDISIHCLHNILHTFAMVLTKRICLTIKNFCSWWSFLYSHDLNVCFKGDADRGKYLLITRRD